MQLLEAGEKASGGNHNRMLAGASSPCPENIVNVVFPFEMHARQA